MLNWSLRGAEGVPKGVRVKVTIKGRIPSKKNSRMQFYNKGLGRVLNIPNKKYKEWHKQASIQLIGVTKVTDDIESVTLSFYFPDKRRTDLTNKAESIMDLLVDNEIIKDDCYTITGTMTLIPRGIDRVNPRCEVVVKLKEG